MGKRRSYNEIIKEFINNPKMISDYEKNILLANELNDNLQWFKNLSAVDLQNRLNTQIPQQDKNYINYLLNEQKVYLGKATVIKSIVDTWQEKMQQYKKQLKETENIKNYKIVEKPSQPIYVSCAYMVNNPYLTTANNNYANNVILQKYLKPIKYNQSCTCWTVGNLYIPIILYDDNDTLVDIFTGKNIVDQKDLYLSYLQFKELDKKDVINILRNANAESVQAYKSQMNQMCSELLQFYNYAYKKQQEQDNEIKLRLLNLGSDYIKN